MFFPHPSLRQHLQWCLVEDTACPHHRRYRPSKSPHHLLGGSAQVTRPRSLPAAMAIISLPTSSLIPQWLASNQSVGGRWGNHNAAPRCYNEATKQTAFDFVDSSPSLIICTLQYSQDLLLATFVGSFINPWLILRPRHLVHELVVLPLYATHTSTFSYSIHQHVLQSFGFPWFAIAFISRRTTIVSWNRDLIGRIEFGLCAVCNSPSRSRPLALLTKLVWVSRSASFLTTVVNLPTWCTTNVAAFFHVCDWFNGDDHSYHVRDAPRYKWFSSLYSACHWLMPCTPPPVVLHFSDSAPLRRDPPMPLLAVTPQLPLHGADFDLRFLHYSLINKSIGFFGFHVDFVLRLSQSVPKYCSHLLAPGLILSCTLTSTSHFSTTSRQSNFSRLSISDDVIILNTLHSPLSSTTLAFSLGMPSSSSSQGSNILGDIPWA